MVDVGDPPAGGVVVVVVVVVQTEPVQVVFSCFVCVVGWPDESVVVDVVSFVPSVAAASFRGMQMEPVKPGRTGAGN